MNLVKVFPVFHALFRVKYTLGAVFYVTFTFRLVDQSELIPDFSLCYLLTNNFNDCHLRGDFNCVVCVRDFSNSSSN